MVRAAITIERQAITTATARQPDKAQTARRSRSLDKHRNATPAPGGEPTPSRLAAKRITAAARRTSSSRQNPGNQFSRTSAPRHYCKTASDTLPPRLTARPAWRWQALKAWRLGAVDTQNWVVESYNQSTKRLWHTFRIVGTYVGTDGKSIGNPHGF
jgi:hypothetical protein